MSPTDLPILHEIIKLQLKKPRNWNWELSTSKSSPHISVPIIQLYDSKGQLLLETKDPGPAQRKSWHSSETRPTRHLQRCRSDTVNNKDFIKNKDKHFDARSQNQLKKSTSDVHFDARSQNQLKKSTSDVLDLKGSSRFYHRSRSDDLYRKTLRLSEESLKRAEQDGYKNFITPLRQRGENKNALLPNSVSNIEVNRLKDSKYKTRTSSAGTLIITEDNFTNCQRRRRRENSSNRVRLDETEQGDKKQGLFYSHSDIFPFVVNNSGSCTAPRQTVEKSEKRTRRKVRRHHSDASTSSGALERRRQKNEARVAKEQQSKPAAAAAGSGDSDLLQLVRRLSSADHVKMGANVSRHSSKGLSGRRSQSSGSICNGKGRRNSDGKICGSLPSYLDDRNSTTGCNNNCEKPPLDEQVQRIPPLGDGAQLHWKFSDNQTVLCDQGYGSERSPEEEYPPPLPDHDSQCHHHLEPYACYPFITPESTFVVKLTKSSRGLGLSVTGGIDSGGSWPGLIRIKRLFPHQPASACGLLNVGDLLLEANGITLTGLTNYEALEVLRTSPNQVDLKLCRPPPDVLSCVSPISEAPPPPPRREPPAILNLPPEIYTTPEDDYYHGEFEVTLTKIQGSLGFTLTKEDDSALGHYVRALVREPALTDGRIRAGDKIIAVNEVEISPMTHEQAVQFLRQSGDVVRLRLYRDLAQTPVTALSPTESTSRASCSKKLHLRQEAIDMLNDIAVRKLIPGQQCSWPRRVVRHHPCPSDASLPIDSPLTSLINDEQFHESLLQRPFDDDLNLFCIESEEDRPSRPSSLDLYNPNQTPVAARKPRFNFSLAHNAYELNNLDAEVLDAPNLTYTLNADDVKSTEVECGDSFPQEPASMPHIPLDNPGFSYKNPAYQSAHPQIGGEVEPKKTDDSNMRKWKGVVFGGSERDEAVIMREEYEILAIELNRGWNSRLGFSLQGAAGVTYVSAVYGDSVAARDGRLKPGDRVIKVNDESVEHMSTSEIIDLLRIVRGLVCIVVSRLKSKDCPQSNAEN